MHFPADFDWKNPRPLKAGLHHGLIALGFPSEDAKPSEVRRVLACYCNRRRYRQAVRVGAVWVDLYSQPAEMITEQELIQAQEEATPCAERLAAERKTPGRKMDTPKPNEPDPPPAGGFRPRQRLKDRTAQVL